MKFKQAPQNISQEYSPKENFLMIKKAMLALSLLYSVIPTEPVVAKTQTETFSEASIDKREGSVEMQNINKKTKERFGVSIEDACEKASCSVVLERSSKNGNYIIHLEQAHYSNPEITRDLEPDLIQQIVASQRIQKRFLEKLARPVIYVEGYQEGSNLDFVSKEIKSQSEALEMREKIISSDLVSQFGPREFFNLKLKRSKIEGVSIIDETYQTSGGEYKLPLRTDEDRVLYTLGAAVVYAAEGGDVTLRGAEMKDFYNDAAIFSVEPNKYDLKNRRNLYNNYLSSRNKHFIASISSTNEIFPIIQLGAIHNLSQTIETNNPDSELGIIRITNKSVYKVLKSITTNKATKN